MPDLDNDVLAELEFLAAERGRLFASATTILDEAKTLWAKTFNQFRGSIERLSQLETSHSGVA